MATLSFLRSNFFIVIVSLFVLAGYGFDVFGECCAHHVQAQTEHSGKTQGNGDDCQCICHQTITPLTAEPVRAVAALLVTSDFAMHLDQIAPDEVPLGIDHPPQLA